MAEHNKHFRADAAIIGGGLSGIVTALELLDHDRKVILLDRDTEERFGGLARESLGGIMMVGTPIQKRMGIHDTPELAVADWMNYAQFDADDFWPQQWAELYVHASLEKIYRWLKKKSVKFLPLISWPERGLYQPGNTIPRQHIAVGIGHGLITTLLKRLNQHPKRSNLTICFNHCVNRLIEKNRNIIGCGGIIEGGGDEFYVYADSIIAASGGICGGDLSRVRRNWLKDWGEPPELLLNGSHRFADGLLHDLISDIGGKITHLNHQWHQAAGIHHPQADRTNHGIRLAPPRSALWLNAYGQRIGPIPLVPYTDSRYIVEQILQQPGQYSWQIMNLNIATRELAVSGSEYMTALRENLRLDRLTDFLFGNRFLIQYLTQHSPDIVMAYNLSELVRKMNLMDNPYQVDLNLIEAEIKQYDAHIDRGSSYFNDEQLRRIANFRNYIPDRFKTCRFQKIMDVGALPLIAIRETILSGQSLGGVQTDLNCRVLKHNGEPVPGLYAVGEAAGFGGGGIHGKRSLEGTFLGSCILTGQAAAEHIATGR